MTTQAPSTLPATTAAAPDEKTSPLIAMPGDEGSCYVADAGVSDEGLGHHLERTVWSGVRWGEERDEEVARLLGEAAKVAATQYVARIGKMTLGVLGPVRSTRHRNTVYFSPFGLKVLKVMGFGALEEGEPMCGEISCGVDSGFLASRHVQDEKRGRLYFRWRWSPESEQEVFETEVRDYTPRLMGRRGRWWGRLFYRLTQVNFHKMVMWGYHWWVRRHRERLLLDAAKQLENRTLAPAHPGEINGVEPGHARLTTDATPT